MIPGVALHGWWYCSQACLDEIQAEAAAHPNPEPPVPRPVKQAEALGKPFGLPHTSPLCAGCDAVLGQEAVYVEQTTGKAFCRACYVISDSPSSFAATHGLPDANSPFGHARQQIGELLIENAELKRQVDQLIKNGLSPEAKEIIELVAENLPTTIERAFKDRALRTAVEHYRQIGALQHSYKCTIKQCVCGVDNICNNL